MTAVQQLIVSATVMATLISLASGAGNCCSECIQCPGSHGSCILHSDLCNGKQDCQHGEDENEAFCESHRDVTCPAGHTQCQLSSGCQLWQYICNQPCPGKADSEICSAFKTGQLPDHLTPFLEEPEPAVDLEQLGQYLLAGNCSAASSRNSTTCPMLYTELAGTCLAVLPFALTWPDALKVCESIGGNLLEFKDIQYYGKVVHHLIEADFTSDFWIGGFFDLEENAWAWSSGAKMPTSTPFWTLKYNTDCVKRRSRASLGTVPGCYHYEKAPTTNEAGRCAALPFRYLYYISDEPCFDRKRLLCVANHGKI